MIYKRARLWPAVRISDTLSLRFVAREIWTENEFRFQWTLYVDTNIRASIREPINAISNASEYAAAEIFECDTSVECEISSEIEKATVKMVIKQQGRTSKL